MAEGMSWAAVRWKKAARRIWNKRVGEAIEQLYQLFFYDKLYIGGGNAKEITIKLPKASWAASSCGTRIWMNCAPKAQRLGGNSGG
jgi:hypothetical protein